MPFVQEHLERAITFGVQSLERSIRTMAPIRWPGVESPLEAVFDLWWMVVLSWDDDCLLIPQKPVEVNGHFYRLDFAVESSKKHQWARAHDLGLVEPQIAVELDGHEFHERTKEQVAYRNHRDRDLQANGWTVIRFSGSEMNRNPEDAVRHVYDRAMRLFWEFERRLFYADRGEQPPSLDEMRHATDT